MMTVPSHGLSPNHNFASFNPWYWWFQSFWAVNPPTTTTSASSQALTYVTAAQASAEQANWSVRHFGVADTAANIASNLASLSRDWKMSSLQLTDANVLSVTSADYSRYRSLLDKLVAGDTVDVASASMSQAFWLQRDAHVGSFSVSDSSWRILSNLGQLAADTKLTGWSVTNTSLVAVSGFTWSAYQPVLDKISGGESLAVVGARANQATAVQNDSHVSIFSVSDTAAHIQASIDQLNADTHLAAINVTDGRLVNFTFTQYQQDTAVRAELRGAPIGVTDITASAANTVWQDPQVWQEGVSDTLANIGTNLDALEKIALQGGLSGIAVTDIGQTLTITAAQYAADIDAIRLMSGSFNIVQGSAIPSPTPAPTPSPTPTGGLHINFIEDASVANAPSAFVSALQTAASMIEATVQNNITLNIEVGWGEIAGQAIPSGVAEGGTNGDIYQSYATVASELTAHVSGPAAASLNLPASDPFGGVSYDVSGAQAKAWGLTPANATGIDGEIGVSSSGWPSTDYVAVLLHEITHAMGRNSGWGGANYDTTPLDLFRYSPMGFIATDGSVVDPSLHPNATGLQYFSIDGGKTAIANFSNSSDYGDWASNSLTANDPFNAYLGSNSNGLTVADFIELGAMGYQLSPAALAAISPTASSSTVLSQAPTGSGGYTTFSGASSLSQTMLASVQSSLMEPHNRIGV